MAPKTLPPAQDGKKKKRSLHERANIIFPAGRIKSQFKKTNIISRSSIKAAIALAAGIEYIVSELLSITLENYTESGKKNKTITAKQILETIDADKELKSLFNRSTLRNSGVVGKINPALLPQKKIVKKK